MTTKENERRRLPRPEAAAYLGISVSNLAKMAVFGTGPEMIRIGRRVVYDTKALDAFLTARIRRSTSDQGGDRVAA